MPGQGTKGKTRGLRSADLTKKKPAAKMRPKGTIRINAGETEGEGHRKAGVSALMHGAPNKDYYCISRMRQVRMKASRRE